jgi:chromosome segregation ATPase
MNNHEFERKMNFIVEQQAQFASDIQKLQESQARTEQAMAHTDQVVAQTAETVGRTAEAVGRTAEVVAETADVVTRLARATHAGFTDVNAKIDALVDAQVRNEERFARADERIARTEENIARTEKNVARTDEALRNLIRHLGKGRNGSNSP